MPNRVWGENEGRLIYASLVAIREGCFTHTRLQHNSRMFVHVDAVDYVFAWKCHVSEMQFVRFVKILFISINNQNCTINLE